LLYTKLAASSERPMLAANFMRDLSKTPPFRVASTWHSRDDWLHR
jgi:hypothetical protein